jgi:HK97 family phage prohead protease
VELYERNFLLDDISIRADGTGRTVVAYAAVFDTPAEIVDRDGHYMETIGRTAFAKTIAERAGQIGVFYNHGKTLYGTPSERYSMPLGTPLEITPDSKGLLTVTRYSKTDLADEVLEGINNGSITGQSFSGRFVASERTRRLGKGLDLIHRTEVALTEFGPTPIPAYKDAAMVGVRTAELADTLRSISPEDREELFRLLDTARSIEPPSPTPDAVSDTSAANEPPAEEGHGSGPSLEARQRRVRALAVSTKGTA